MQPHLPAQLYQTGTGRGFVKNKKQKSFGNYEKNPKRKDRKVKQKNH